MSEFNDIPETDIERLFAGLEPEESGLEAVSEFLGNVEALYPLESTSGVEAQHVAAMVAAAEATDPVERPARRHRTAWGARLRAHRVAVAASISAICVLAFGGAAFAGVLPAPLQQATSEVAARVGITVPAHYHRKITPMANATHAPGQVNRKATGVARPKPSMPASLATGAGPRANDATGSPSARNTTNRRAAAAAAALKAAKAKARQRRIKRKRKARAKRRIRRRLEARMRRTTARAPGSKRLTSTHSHNPPPGVKEKRRARRGVTNWQATKVERKRIRKVRK